MTNATLPPPAKVSKISLRDARSFEETSLELHPGFNVVVGPTDSGKSNLFRAVHAVATNDTAANFVRTGMTSGFASVEFTDGVRVGLAKGEKVNAYTLDRPGSAPTEFREVGAGIPPDVAAALRLGSVKFSDEEADVHFASQRGPAFGVDDSPSRVATIVGDVSGLDVVFRALSRADDERKATTAALKAAEKLAVEARKIYEAESTAEDLEALRALVDEAQAAHDGALRAQNAVDALTEASVTLRNDLSVYTAYAREAVDVKDAHDSVAHAADGLEDLGYRCRLLESAVATLHGWVENLRNAETQHANAKAALALAEAELERFVAENPACPLCGGTLSETHLHE